MAINQQGKKQNLDNKFYILKCYSWFQIQRAEKKYNNLRSLFNVNFFKLKNQMRISRPLLNSPRMNSPKQLKSVPSLELNSYKIDTSSLSEKAKQIQTLKTSLQSQISQYKASQSMFHEEIDKLSEENTELRIQIKKLQTELNKLKLEGPSSPKALSKIPSKSQQNQIKLLKINIQALQEEVRSLKDKLALKNEEILELSEYKKMYDIEVENKNNIMNFYQNKLALFKRDKGVLISKYEQKISQLGSNLEMNNATMIQMKQAVNPSSSVNSTIKSFPTSKMPNGIKSNNALKELGTEKNVSSKQIKDGSVGDEQHRSSSKNIKIIRPSKSKPSINIQQSFSYQKEKNQQTPYKLMKASQTNESRNKENTPISNKSVKNQINQISVNSLANGRNDMLINRDPKKKQSPKKHSINLGGTGQTLRNNDSFLRMIKKISSNLRDLQIKSENLKSFVQIKNFMSMASPLPSQVIQLLETYPLGPTNIERLSLEQCIQRMRRHLEKRYSSWSGSLLVELLIDKIEDVEIAYQVNSQQDDIAAALSSEEEIN